MLCKTIQFLKTLCRHFAVCPAPNSVAGRKIREARKVEASVWIIYSLLQKYIRCPHCKISPIFGILAKISKFFRSVYNNSVECIQVSAYNPMNTSPSFQFRSLLREFISIFSSSVSLSWNWWEFDIWRHAKQNILKAQSAMFRNCAVLPHNRATTDIQRFHWLLSFCVAGENGY